MNSSKFALIINDYLPQRIGLSYDTNEIVIEYMLVSMKKLYHHKIDLSQFSEDMSTESIIDELYAKDSHYLNHPDVIKAYIIDAVNKIVLFKNNKRIQSKVVNREYNRQSSKNTNEDSFESTEDLNQLSNEQLEIKKREMDKYYEQNRIKTDDTNFQYDIRVRLITNNFYLGRL